MSEPVHHSIALDHPEPEHEHKAAGTQQRSGGAQAADEVKQGVKEIQNMGEKLRQNVNSFVDEMVPTKEKQEREMKPATHHAEGTNLQPATERK